VGPPEGFDNKRGVLSHEPRMFFCAARRITRVRRHLVELFELQKVDLAIRDLERKRGDIPSQLQQLQENVAKTQAEISLLTTERQALEKESKTLEGTISAESHKLKKWEQRLADIRNQREYLALSREVEGSKRANREAEERIGEIATRRQTIDVQLETLQDRLAEGEVDAGAERTRVDTEVESLNTQLANENARRQSLLPHIPKLLLKRYETIRAKRMGLGLALVVDGSCQGCNMKLPPQLYNILQRADTVEQCPSCSRLMIWDRLVEKEAEAAGAKNAEAPA
jgi:predicted  nucleic acid-binding Zn-ribbon protein